MNVIVALTHLTFADDRVLANRFPEINVIIGGHEHYPITATHNRTLISKAGSDAKWVARIDVNRGPAGIDRFYELIPVTNVCHFLRVNRIIGPDVSMLSRITRRPSVSLAASTH